MAVLVASHRAVDSAFESDRSQEWPGIGGNDRGSMAGKECGGVRSTSTPILHLFFAGGSR